MEFLRSFLRRHYAWKPVLASPNVGCFVRLSFTALKEVALTPLNQTTHYEADQLLANPGGVPLRVLGRGVPPGSPNPEPIQTQECHFSHPFSDSKIQTRFQT